MLFRSVPAYFADRPAVDLLGRSDRYIARLVVDRFLPGHSKWDSDYVIHVRRPDLILGAGRDLLERPDFRVLYLEARSREGLVFFVRREAVPKLLDERIVLSDLWTGRPLDRTEALAPARAPCLAGPSRKSAATTSYEPLRPRE